LEIISVTAVNEHLKKQYYRYQTNLILDVCFNFIKTTENERQQMIDDPKDFVNLALDTCDKQQSMIVKTQAAKVLEAICDNIDGAITLAA
jgi:chaperonin cofactor prefoldin